MANFDGCVFIGISVDGFIAGENGDLDWLTSAGAALGDAGYDEFFASIDALVMGRKTYETVLGFGAWPYSGKRVLVLSSTLGDTGSPATSIHKSLDDVVATLDVENVKRVYVDGGQTIQAFLRAGLIAEMTISRAPVLLGSGAPLFGPLDADVPLTLQRTRELGAGFTQSTYAVRS